MHSEFPKYVPGPDWRNSIILEFLIDIIVSGAEPDCGGGIPEGEPGTEEPGENP